MELQVRVTRWPNGQLKEQYPYYVDAEAREKRHGIAEAWYENGKRKGQWRWVHGKRNGTFIVWRSDGTVASIGCFKEDQPHDVFKSWRRDGRLESETEYREGHLIQGEFFSATGELVSTVQEGSGEQIDYHDNGVQMCEIMWKDGLEAKSR